MCYLNKKQIIDILNYEIDNLKAVAVDEQSAKIRELFIYYPLEAQYFKEYIKEKIKDALYYAFIEKFDELEKSTDSFNKLRDSKLDKPPRGIIPRKIHREQRLKEIKEKIVEYQNDNRTVPVKWIIEYNDLLRELKEGYHDEN